MTVSAACETITVTLKHAGQLPANIMGHNWVLTKSSDFMPVAQAGGAAGLENDYVPQNDPRVIAYSKIIGGGETTTVTFSTADLSKGVKTTRFSAHFQVLCNHARIVEPHRLRLISPLTRDKGPERAIAMRSLKLSIDFRKSLIAFGSASI